MMNKNVKIARQLVKLAKSLVAYENEKRMKFRDFIKQDIDIDTNDGIIDWEIAFCGPCKLTEEGEKHFAPLMDKDIVFDDSTPGYKWAQAEGLTNSEGKLFREFLQAHAGYVSTELFDKWFILE